MSLVSGTRDGRKVYSNVLCVNPDPDVGGQINDGIRQPRLDRAEQFRIDRVDGKGGGNFSIRSSHSQGETLLGKDRGGRGEKEFSTKASRRSIKKAGDSAAAKSMARQQEQDLSFEGR
jgi:hypothetical protein